MSREYLVSGSQIDPANDSIVLKGKRSANGPEMNLRVPIGTLLSLAMHCRRAMQGHLAKQASQKTHGWKAVHPLPVQTVQILPTDDRTMGPCLLVCDPGTDVELQLSFPTIDLVRQLGQALLEAADQSEPRTSMN